MSEQQATHLRRIGDWLAVELEIRVSRKILAIAGFVLIVLIAVALH
jgi:hypothetical protein